MFFPIIKVKDNSSGHEHIVGANSHDQLYIDKETGGIHYLNLQCCESTQIYDNEQAFSFQGKESEWPIGNLEIEMVPIEEIIEIAIQNMKDQTEAKINMDKMIAEFLKEKEECKEKLKGAIPDTSGMTY